MKIILTPAGEAMTDEVGEVFPIHPEKIAPSVAITVRNYVENPQIFSERKPFAVHSGFVCTLQEVVFLAPNEYKVYESEKDLPANQDLPET